jgi:hypothetical protein
VIDVHVDAVRHVDVRRLAAEAELAAEDEQQHEHDDDQQNDGENAAATTAATGLDHGRMFALNVVAIVVGHGNSPCISLLCWRNERKLTGPVPAKRQVHESPPFARARRRDRARLLRTAAPAAGACQK